MPFFFYLYEKKTLEFVLKKEKEFGQLNRMQMGVWEAIEYVSQ